MLVIPEIKVLSKSPKETVSKTDVLTVKDQDLTLAISSAAVSIV